MNQGLRILLFLLFYISANAQKISVRYLSNTQNNFSGNVFLYLNKDNKDPKGAFVGLESFPCFRIAVKNIKPNQAVVFDDAAVSYPVPLSDIERGEYYVQAVWDNNLGGRAIGNTPGNIYNAAVKIKFSKERNQAFNITCEEVVKNPTFTETETAKEIKLESKLLTAFYGRPTTINGTVLLPKEYKDQPQRKFPVLYYISGYGGDYHRFSGRTTGSPTMDTTAVIMVFMDGSCSLGHSVYANSANNGPWGDAFTQEWIPEIEKNYRCNGARLLHGHSSGGWTVLWLQLSYPKVFTGCWASSPDPVDFRNFQNINLYSDKSFFYGKDSVLRMLATVGGGFPWVTMKQWIRMEYVISRGEQMRSFDAVFSPKGNDGIPRPLFNYQTGEIDSVTANYWKKYDICLFLRTHWDALTGDLQGKIRVTAGDQDNFYLNNAVHMLDDEMKKLNTGFEFKYYPGDHFTVYSPEYRMDGQKFLEKKCNEYLSQQVATQK